MSGRSFRLSVLPERLAICRLPPEADVPAWAVQGRFFAVTRTPDELSVVCEQERVPATVLAQRDYLALGVAGPLDFSEVGILAALTRVLAEAMISIFALSTYDTDYLLLREEHLPAAITALTEAGNRVTMASSL